MVLRTFHGARSAPGVGVALPRRTWNRGSAVIEQVRVLGTLSERLRGWSQGVSLLGAADLPRSF